MPRTVQAWRTLQGADRPRALSSGSSHAETHAGRDMVGSLGSLLRECCVSTKCSAHSGSPYSRRRSGSAPGADGGQNRTTSLATSPLMC